MGRGRTTDGPLLVYGVNAVEGLLRADVPVDRLHVTAGRGTERIAALARRRGVRCDESDRATLDRLAGTPHHQGAVATTVPYRYADLDAVGATGRGVLLLDSVQ